MSKNETANTENTMTAEHAERYTQIRDYIAIYDADSVDEIYEEHYGDMDLDTGVYATEENFKRHWKTHAIEAIRETWHDRGNTVWADEYETYPHRARLTDELDGLWDAGDEVWVFATAEQAAKAKEICA